jgi:MoxR-like ATPase
VGGYAENITALRQALNDALRGKPEVVEFVLTCLLARGHMLLEDRPGLGKTTLAKALAHAVGGKFARIQCTPDLLPGDITGFNMFNQKTREFEFVAGPVFADVLLVDEINRTTPRTQSALLEVMAEGQVTVDNVRRPLDQHFLVIATQNPLELHGTYPLPEAQLDRFAVKLRIGYPDREHELDLLERAVGVSGDHQPPAPVLTPGTLAELQSLVAAVAVERQVRDYLVRLAEATRVHPQVTLGVSPRGLLIWQRMAQAWAWLQGRQFVTPGDVQAVAAPVLEVRLAVTGGDPKLVITEILAAVELPVYPAADELQDGRLAGGNWFGRLPGALRRTVPLLLTCSLVIVAGCGRSAKHNTTASVGQADDDDDDHEHHVPAHRPRDFPHAVERIRELHRAIQRALATSDREAAAAQLSELMDDVRWLPEIAGDSDMPEAEWNEVNRISRELANLVEPERNGDQRGAPSPGNRSSARIEQLIDRLSQL